MASAVLARQIGYPGSSIAFAQLLSGMERAGLIRREVRGKRTYRIRLVTAPPRAAGPAATGQASSNGAGSSPPEATEDLAGFDYDELARRLLVLLVRRLTAASGQEQTVADLEQE